jgi:hypothetical protein
MFRRFGDKILSLSSEPLITVDSRIDQVQPERLRRVVLFAAPVARGRNVDFTHEEGIEFVENMNEVAEP